MRSTDNSSPEGSGTAGSPSDAVKVLLVSHNSNLSGAPISLAQLARKLPDHGWVPLVVIPRRGPLEDMLRKWNVRYTVLRSPFALLEFIRIVRKEKPRIVHVNSLVRTWPVIAARLLGKPVLWHVREYLGNKRGYARLIHLLADHVILISREQYSLFSGLKRVSLVPNAVDADIFNGAAPVKLLSERGGHGARKRETLVLFVGSIEPRKGVVVLARAAALLEDRPWIHFLVVGKASSRHEEYLKEIEWLVRRLSIGNRFHLIGPRSDVPSVMASVDIFCHPAYVEAFGRVVLEAMAAKLPVVASRIGEIPEMVEDGKTGILVEPGDENALAEAIRTLDSDGKLRKAMGRAGYRKVKKEFSIDRHARTIAGLYGSVISRR